jgi:hypothetical protein
MSTLNSVFADSRPTVADASGADVQTALVTGAHPVAYCVCEHPQAGVARSTPRPAAKTCIKAGVRHAQP